MREILVAYMEWLQQKEDVFYGFDDIERSIDEFLEENS